MDTKFRKIMDHSQEARSDIEEMLNNSHILLRQGNFQDAKVILNKALSLDFDKDEVITALKSISFWEERKIKLLSIQEDKQRGEYLFDQWENYLVFIQRCNSVCDELHYPLKQWVFGQALTYFQSEADQKGKHDPELLCFLGRAYKGVGDYEHAVEYFEIANHQKQDDPEILAELADSYAFINEIKAAKVFFREAFFIDPQRIKVEYLESMLILRLIEEVRKVKKSLEELKEWIPVYGNIFGVFNVKRELKPLEFGKLKQSIYQYEENIANDADENNRTTMPRLLNRYFWLVDHLLSTKQDRKKVDEVLQNIKQIDEDIYEKLIQ